MIYREFSWFLIPLSCIGNISTKLIALIQQKIKYIDTGYEIHKRRRRDTLPHIYITLELRGGGGVQTPTLKLQSHRAKFTSTRAPPRALHFSVLELDLGKLGLRDWDEGEVLEVLQWNQKRERIWEILTQFRNWFCQVKKEAEIDYKVSPTSMCTTCATCRKN